MNSFSDKLPYLLHDFEGMLGFALVRFFAWIAILNGIAIQGFDQVLYQFKWAVDFRCEILKHG
ncbi:MAG: hypothetical protein A3A86_00565 [Elusimicrobia bacterium RIFCSPLOWO2_01_FULL_60_11]|nr:MAG: hypothetical protein A3A86_00565 [Elusimicrobia bacterium RIFCSPLOWO2_01_FULL_60_11]